MASHVIYLQTPYARRQGWLGRDPAGGEVDGHPRRCLVQTLAEAERFTRDHAQELAGILREQLGPRVVHVRTLRSYLPKPDPVQKPRPAPPVERPRKPDPYGLLERGVPGDVVVSHYAWERRHMIWRAREHHGLTYRAIAESMGITHERVRCT